MSLMRSSRVNIALAVGSKAISILIALLSVPLLLRILGTQAYGTWVTLTSLIAFIGLLDLGVGNSIRNSVASSGAVITESVRVEFVCFFHLLLGIGLLALVVFLVSARFADLLSNNFMAASLLYAPLLLLLPFLLARSVMQGAHATGVQEVLQTLGTASFFAILATFAWLDYAPRFEDLAAIWSLSYGVALCVVFGIALRLLRLPVAGLLKRSWHGLKKGRLRVGLAFLTLQIASLVLYSMGNVLIYKYLGAGEVARYDVLNKIFQVGLSFYLIVIGVMWSKIALHRANGDVAALRKTLLRLSLLAVLFACGAIGTAFLAPWIVDQWTGQRIHVTRTEAAACAVLVALQALAYVGAVFMNAFEKMGPQVWLAAISIALMAPISAFLFDHGLGIASIPVAAALLTIFPMVVCLSAAIRLINSVTTDPAPQ